MKCQNAIKRNSGFSPELIVGMTIRSLSRNNASQLSTNAKKLIKGVNHWISSVLPTLLILETQMGTHRLVGTSDKQLAKLNL